MSKFLKLSTLFFALLLIFSSCEKENVDSGPVIDPNTPDPTHELTNNLIGNLTTRSGEEGCELGCVTINYPFELLLEDGSTLSIDEDGDFETLFEDSTIIVIDFVYPLDVSVEEEDFSVANAEELGELFASCIPDGGWNDGFPAFIIDEENSCYELVYPLTVSDLDGNDILVSEEVELTDAIAANEIVFFNFPLNLLDEDDQVVTANDIDGLFGLLAECEDFSEPCDSTITFGGEIGCFTLVFPLDLILTDSSTITVANEDEFFTALISGEISDFIYPFSVLDEDGNEIEVLDAAMLSELLISCDGGPNANFDPGVILLLAGTESECFTVSFPVNGYSGIDSSSIVVNDFEELIEALELSLFQLIYPVEVTLNADGTVHQLGDAEEISALLEDCN